MDRRQSFCKPKLLPAGFACHDALYPSIVSVKSTKVFARLTDVAVAEGKMEFVSYLLVTSVHWANAPSSETDSGWTARHDGVTRRPLNGLTVIYPHYNLQYKVHTIGVVLNDYPSPTIYLAVTDGNVHHGLYLQLQLVPLQLGRRQLTIGDNEHCSMNNEMSSC